ncbi:MAG: hypothetical protein IIZ26_04195 [Oscillospiraceae bacterium]|nr:hypothetical protein [Oscillospiraceae bacterium]
MKRLMVLLLTLLMVCSLAACGGSKQGDNDFVWTRVGTYQDENENYLMVSASEMEEYPGWSVMCMIGDEMHGWFIQQEGNTLHGNLTSEYEDADDFIVTISEEDEDGLQMVVEGGETYHFKPMDVPEATIIVHVNTEGIGAIEYAEGEEAPEFDPEHPYQSAQINLAEPTTYTFLATAYEDGWKFVKWTKDGTDYSTDAQITLELAESADYVAVFEYEGQ